MRVKDRQILPRVLFTLVNATVAISGAGSRHAGSVHRAFRKFDELQKISDEQLRQIVRYAIDKKYITVTHRAGKDIIELTKEGTRVSGRFAIAELKLPRLSSWDRKWRVVLFDIPEEFKKSRDGFAANLKRIGLVQVQKSAFAYPHPCFEEIEILADFHGVQSFLTYIVADSLKPEKTLKKTFGILK